MKTRTIVAVVFLGLVGAGVVWKLARKDPHVREASQTAQAQAGVPSLKQAEIDELELTEAKKPAVHLKKDGEWKLLAPVADRADQKNVEATLQALEKMKLKDVVAESAT